MMEVCIGLLLVLNNCKEGEVLLMDSMFRGRVAHQTKRQICSILNSDKKRTENCGFASTVTVKHY